MKRLVNSSKNYALLMIKPNNDVDYEGFQGCDPKFKYDLIEVVNQNNEMFHEPKRLPPKGEFIIKYSWNKIVLFLTLECIGCW